MASVLKVDKLDPQSGTALEIGTSGDTVTVPTGAGLTVTDEVKTNKISPATGAAFALGDSGDTFTVPSGATIVNSGTATGFGVTNTPNFMIRQGTATSLVNATRTKVELNTAIFDTDSGLDAANDRWTVPTGKGGTYLITYSLRFQSATDFDSANALVYKNGSAFYSIWGANVYYNTFAGSFLAVLAATDYLEMYGQQISGGAIDASTTDYGLQTYLGGVRLTT
jgi:hypothetical protein